MRNLIILISVLLTAVLAASSPVYPERLVMRNSPETQVSDNQGSARSVFRLYRRNAPSIKTQQPLPQGVRKGEYICGDKICKLKPGEKPPCRACQYPV